jgi:hypothetical protein
MTLKTSIADNLIALNNAAKTLVVSGGQIGFLG